MRIHRRNATTEHADAIERSMVAAARGVSISGRVCGAQCDIRCQRCGATTCQCACSPYCAEAPRSLSSDAAFPIEPLIAPLVYEMKRSGCFEPCWSCEGHNGPDGALLKAPTIWFYCTLPYLRLLAGGLVKLRLHAPWRIVVTHSDADNPEPTFALEAPRDGFSLEQLQMDVAQLARAFPDMIKSEAQALLAG